MVHTCKKSYKGKNTFSFSLSNKKFYDKTFISQELLNYVGKNMDYSAICLLNLV